MANQDETTTMEEHFDCSDFQGPGGLPLILIVREIFIQKRQGIVVDLVKES